MAEKTLMNKEEIMLSLKRIARQIVEKNKALKEVVLIGIMNRGVPLAERIAKMISTDEKVSIPVGALDVSMHRDDIQKKGSDIEIRQSDIPFSIDGKTVVLVDDVISAGRTIRAAMDALADYGRASKIELVALIDRDQRELPINPDFTGKAVNTLKDEEVMVQVQEIDGIDKVIIK
jgi:pyrimidine operon attenuation protein / uracil phosphoribosyltransferase